MNEILGYRSYLLVSLLLAGLLLISPAQGDEVRPEEEPDPPSAELLEFLADWETADGGWLDPMEFMEETSEDHSAREGVYEYD